MMKSVVVVMTSFDVTLMAGPTGPNRMMLHAATTRGYDGGQYDSGPYLMHARTIYEDLQDEGAPALHMTSACRLCLLQVTVGEFTGECLPFQLHTRNQAYF